VREQIGSDDRLISLRRTVVGHKKVLIGNAIQGSVVAYTLRSADHPFWVMWLGVAARKLSRGKGA
jgi:hypothetical protein